VEHRGPDGSAGADDLQLGSIARPCEPIHYLTIEALHGRRRRHGIAQAIGANEAVRQRSRVRRSASHARRACSRIAAGVEDRARVRDAKSRQAAARQPCCFCKCLDETKNAGAGRAPQSSPAAIENRGSVRMQSVR
jgi:hypothetical protein